VKWSDGAMFLLIALPLIFAVNYLSALAGEPRAVWLMQILGVY